MEQSEERLEHTVRKRTMFEGIHVIYTGYIAFSKIVYADLLLDKTTTLSAILQIPLYTHSMASLTLEPMVTIEPPVQRSSTKQTSLTLSHRWVQIAS